VFCFTNHVPWDPATSRITSYSSNGRDQKLSFIADGDVSIPLCRGKRETVLFQPSASVFDHFTTVLYPISSIHRCYSQRRIKRYHFYAYLDKIQPTMSPCLPASQSRSPVLLGGCALEAQTPGFSDTGLFAISTTSNHFILNENHSRWSRAF
jgi:hypothetical protein